MAKHRLIAVAGGISLVCVAVALIFTAWAADRPPPSSAELHRAAQPERASLLQIMQVDPQMFGLTHAPTDAQLQLGEPYPVAILQPKQAGSYGPKNQPDDVLDATDVWRFPIVIDGRARGFATFKGSRDAFVLVGASGEAATAQRLISLTDQLSAPTTNGMKLIGVPQLGLTLLLAHQQGQPMVYVVSGIPNDVPMLDATKPYRPDEVFPILGKQAEQAQRVLP